MRDYAELTRRLADLVVVTGANVQPGQIVGVTSYIGKEELTREVTRAAYERGARWVDVLYFDQWLKRERIRAARSAIDEASSAFVDDVPPWMLERLEWFSAERAARITLQGPHAPTALEGLDPARAGRDLLPYLPLTGEVVNRRTTNWCVIPAPTVEWAELVFPTLRGEDALGKLWETVGHICRLDTDDPADAWADRFGQLADVAAGLTERRFDSTLQPFLEEGN